MKKARLAIVSITSLCLSVSAFGQPSSSPADARATMRVVPIYLSDLRALAMLRIGDSPPAPVVFDTGATSNSIDTDYAAALKLEFDPTVHVHVGDGTGNTIDAKQAKVPVATLGEVPLAAKTATIFPYKERDVVGIFVPDSFLGRQVLLDLRHGRLIIRSRDAGSPCTSSTPYTPSGLPTVMLHLPGLSLPAVLDTGSNSPLVLDTGLARRLPLRHSLQSAGKGTTVTGRYDVFQGRLAGEIRIGPLVLRDALVKFSGSDASIPYIGLPIIRQLLIMLDPGARRACIVDPPSLSAPQLTGYAGRYGTRTIRNEGDALIYQRDGRAPYELRPLAHDLFASDETGDVVQFWRENGRVVRMDVVNNIGTLTSADKSAH
jgi:hypothetical protein